MWLECSQNVAREISQSVIGGHWRSSEMIGGHCGRIEYKYLGVTAKDKYVFAPAIRPCWISNLFSHSVKGTF